jgi:hypothetical protein
MQKCCGIVGNTEFTEIKFWVVCEIGYDIQVAFIRK